MEELVSCCECWNSLRMGIADAAKQEGVCSWCGGADSSVACHVLSTLRRRGLSPPLRPCLGNIVTMRENLTQQRIVVWGTRRQNCAWVGEAPYTCPPHPQGRLVACGQVCNFNTSQHAMHGITPPLIQKKLPGAMFWCSQVGRCKSTL